MRWEQKLQHATLSDIGLRRQNNEDSSATHICHDEGEFDHRGHLFVVADGMGGHAVGELASQMAVEAVPHTWFKVPGHDPREALRVSITAANKLINERGSQNRDFLRMGTTCTALALTPRGAVIGHVGDSRCYRIRRDRIDQLTFDHSLQWEMQRQNRRLANEAAMLEHRNIITRSLGPEPSVDVDMEGPFLVLPGDIFVLCSDGLSGEVKDEEIGALAGELSPAQACRMLVHLANLRGGADNCTVTVVRVGDLPANVAPPQLPTPDDGDAGLDWTWLGLGWAAACLCLMGFLLIAFSRPWVGAGFIGCALAAFGWIFAVMLRQRRSRQIPESDLSRTNYWRPYRTAISQPMQQMLENLLAVEAELSRAAREEGWPVNWSQHTAALQAAAEARTERRFARGVRDAARAIDLLMTPMYAFRRESKNVSTR
ncbi:MAG: serine/threonine-protein phosphatase [Planctomyces sp.]|nr:serine/threonine-protein phosphatase [Planctomyces sp.]